MKAFEFKIEKEKENFVRGHQNENIPYFIDKSGVKSLVIKYTQNKEPYIYSVGSEDSLETL